MIAKLEERDAQLLTEAEAEIKHWLDQIRHDREAIAAELEQATFEARRLRSVAVAESETILRVAREQAKSLLEEAIAEADHLGSLANGSPRNGNADAGGDASRGD